MRLLLIVCGSLLLTNVAIFLWPNESRGAPHVYAVQQDINPHFVRLNKEVEEKFYAAQSSNGPADDAVLAAGANGNCYRLGPFMHKSNYELAQAVLLNANVEYRKSTRKSKESSVYRVYLGPFTSKAVADDVRTELRRKSVLDHFIRKEEDGQFVISLGIYTTLESGERAVSLFDGQLENVKLRQEVVLLPDTYWLHFSMNDEDQKRQQLASMDWGERSAKIGKFECQSI